MRSAERVLADWDVEALLDRWFYTPVGRRLARALVPSRVRPNQVSFTSLVCGVVAGGLLAAGGALPLFGAGLLVLASVVLDAADGELARARRQASETGKLFDNTADSVKTGAIVLGTTIGLWLDGPWSGWAGLRAWAIGVLLGASLIGQVVTRNHFVSLYRRHAEGRHDDPYATMEKVRAELEAMRRAGGFWLERLVVGPLLFFSRAPALPPSASETPPPPSEAYAVRLLPHVRAWSFFGGATQLTALGLATAAGVPLYGALFVAVAMNAVFIPLKIATTHAHEAAVMGSTGSLQIR